MAKDEALKVLNFERKPKSINELVERYDRYFAANDPNKGGSLYVQSKVLRAKEVLEEEYPEDERAEFEKLQAAAAEDAQKEDEKR